MSKDFEKEYKEYLNAQAPDLWERIEAGISDEEKIVSLRKGKKRRRKNSYKYRMIMTAAAAVALLIIAVPVSMLFGYGKKEHVMQEENQIYVAQDMVENIELNEELQGQSEEGEIPLDLNMLQTESVDAAPDNDMQETASDGDVDESIETVSEENPEVSETLEEQEMFAVAGTKNDASKDDSLLGDTQGDGEITNQKILIVSEGEACEEGMLYKAVISQTDTALLLLVKDSALNLENGKGYLVSAIWEEGKSYYTIRSATKEE